jgi:hypothetical protein
MRWPGEAGRAKRFARLLDDPAPDAPDAPVDPELAPLVAVVNQLRAVDQIQPVASFRTALRSRLVSLAATEVAPGPAAPGTLLEADAVPTTEHRGSHADVVSLPGAVGPPARWRRPRLGLAAASLVLLALAGLAVVGSRNALPGDPLYALKRGTENAELALARGDEARGLRYLHLARVRAQEVRDLPGRDDDAGAATYVDTLGVMDTQTKAGTRLLTTAAVSRVADGMLVSLGAWTVQQYGLLQAASSHLPTAAQPRLADSLVLLREVGDRVVALRSRLNCSCLARAPGDDLGPLPCDPCGTAAASSSPGPARSSTPPSSPGRTSAPPAQPDRRRKPPPWRRPAAAAAAAHRGRRRTAAVHPRPAAADLRPAAVDPRAAAADLAAAAHLGATANAAAAPAAEPAAAAAAEPAGAGRRLTRYP